MRRLIYQIHLYIGLTAGAVFVLLGLTGSVLVFEEAIDDRLNSGAVTAQAPGPPVSLDTVLAAARRAVPAGHSIFRIIAPPEEDDVFEVWATIPAGAGGGYSITYVDPAGGDVLAQRTWGESLTGFIYKLHANLQLGHAGEILVGATGVLMLLTMLFALVLWWPRRGRVGQSFKIHFAGNGRGVNFALHRLFGFYALLLLFVVTFSGVYIVFPGAITGVVDSVLHVDTQDTAPQSMLQAGAPPIGPERAAAIAMAEFPRAKFKRIGLPAAPEGVYRVSLRQPGEVQKSYGQTYVWVDQYSGEVLEIQDYFQASAGNLILNWQFPLHNGEAFGLAGRWVIFALGFLPLVLYITGFALWLKSRKAKREREAMMRRLEWAKAKPQSSAPRG